MYLSRGEGKDDEELRLARPPWGQRGVRNWTTWRPVVARVAGRWRWAVVANWVTDGRSWICHLYWADDRPWMSAQSGWYFYDPRFVRPLEPLPDDWQPSDEPGPGDEVPGDRSPRRRRGTR